MSGRILSDPQLAAYRGDGYVCVPQLFDNAEIDLLRRAAKEDHELDKRSFGRDDGEGGTVRLSMWNQPGEGIYGMISRCECLVDSVEKILAGEVYHYHSKIIMKDAKIGGAWTWHQDYGYWYDNGLLFPLLASVWIAIDPASKDNGCMQVLRGSQQMGRINHFRSGQQAGADLERVDEACKRFEHVYCEMDPGDALFFDCNLLHRSDRNVSDRPRWNMICCYNAARNDPYKDSHHPRYTPLDKVPDSMIKEIGIKRFADDTSDVSWINDAMRVGHLTDRQIPDVGDV